MASVRSYQKLPPCLTEPMPASSKKAKAEPISNRGMVSDRASGIPYLRMEKITVPKPLQPEKEVRKCETHVGPIWGGLLLWEGPHAGAGEGERSSPQENAVNETKCDGPSTTPILHPPVSLGRRGREFWGEVESRKKEGIKGIFKIWGLFSLPYSDWLLKTKQSWFKVRCFC